ARRQLRSLVRLGHRPDQQGDRRRRRYEDGNERHRQGRLHRTVPAGSRAPVLLPALRAGCTGDGEELQGSRGARSGDEGSHPRAVGADGTLRENQEVEIPSPKSQIPRSKSQSAGGALGFGLRSVSSHCRSGRTLLLWRSAAGASARAELRRPRLSKGRAFDLGRSNLRKMLPTQPSEFLLYVLLPSSVERLFFCCQVVIQLGLVLFLLSFGVRLVLQSVFVHLQQLPIVLSFFFECLEVLIENVRFGHRLQKLVHRLVSLRVDFLLVLNTALKLLLARGRVDGGVPIKAVPCALVLFLDDRLRFLNQFVDVLL